MYSSVTNGLGGARLEAETLVRKVMWSSRGDVTRAMGVGMEMRGQIREIYTLKLGKRRLIRHKGERYSEDLRFSMWSCHKLKR